MSLAYLEPEDLQLEGPQLPRTAWPAPRSQLPPFAGGWTDYVRVAGPGVYVGVGLRTEPGWQPGPLFFTLALERVEPALAAAPGAPGA